MFKFALQQQCAMQEMNYIHLSRPDYRAISGSAMLPTQNRRCVAPVFIALHANNAITLKRVMEHNAPQAYEKIGREDGFFNFDQLGSDCFESIVKRMYGLEMASLKQI
jgi:hypothetical protein